MKAPALVEVQWLDAHFFSQDKGHFADEVVALNPPAVLTNIGYLVAANDEQTFLAASMELSEVERPGQYLFRDIMVIPTRMVLKKKTIRRGA